MGYLATAVPDGIRTEAGPVEPWHQTGGADPGRDGSRVPLPWARTEPPFGFSPGTAEAQPWLPQPVRWRDMTVEETADPASMLELYRAALHGRRAEPALGDGPMTWQPSPDGVLAFDRGASVRCMVNRSGEPAVMPEHAGVLLASGPLDGPLLPRIAPSGCAPGRRPGRSSLATRPSRHLAAGERRVTVPVNGA